MILLQKRIVLLLFFLCTFLHTYSQEIPLQISYYAPYGVQYGGKISTIFTYKNWPADSTNTQWSHQFQIGPQLAYFVFPQVQQNVLINAEFLFRTQKIGSRFYPLGAIGLGYLISVQQQDGTIHLGTGKVTHNSTTLHQFVPTVNLGFGVDPKKHLGFYFKAFYGGKTILKEENEALFGAELGLHIVFKKTNQ